MEVPSEVSYIETLVRNDIMFQLPQMENHLALRRNVLKYPGGVQVSTSPENLVIWSDERAAMLGGFPFRFQLPQLDEPAGAAT